MMKISLFLLAFISIGTLHAQKNFSDVANRLQVALKDYEASLSEKSNSSIAQAAYEIGNIYDIEGLSDKAIEYYKLGYESIEKDKNNLLIPTFLRGLRNAYEVENKIDSALYYAPLLYQYYEKNGLYEPQLDAYQKIGQLHEADKNWVSAVNVYNSIRFLTGLNKDTSEMIVAINNVGYNQHKLGNYQEAINSFLEIEALNERWQSLNPAILFTNMGVTYASLDQYGKAFEYFQKADKKTEKDPIQKARIAFLTASLYLQEKDWYNAQQYNNEVILLATQTKQDQLLGNAYSNAAQIHEGLFEYEDALNYYQKHLTIKDSLLLEERLTQQTLLQNQFLLEKAEKEIKLFLVNEKINKLAINRLQLEKNNILLESEKLSLVSAQREASLALLQKEKAIQDADLANQQLASLQAKQQLRIARQRLEAEQKDRNIAELEQREALQKAQLAEQKAAEAEQAQKLELLNKEKALNELELKNQASFKQFAYALGGLLLALFALAGFSYFRSQRNNRLLQKQQAETESERAKSEALLLNILPSETAKELKNTGVATPKHYDKVSVLFTDFVNFTTFAENIAADQLIKELNDCFVAFDDIVERNGLEKIKTIGDSFMCAGGIPTANQTNPADAIRAGLEMQQFMTNRIAQRKAKQLPYCEMRLGIHTGPVVAGVVGKNKFAYDIWGDTVNLSSRIESNCVPGQVNISEATYELVKQQFKCQYRGEIEAKNKGKVKMYFVDEQLP